MTATDKVYKLRRWGWSWDRIAVALDKPLEEIHTIRKREKLPLSSTHTEPDAREIRRQLRTIMRFDKVGGI